MSMFQSSSDTLSLVKQHFLFSDIDECAQDTHNCSKDGALCNNTEGSFNCTCKRGFTGDGYNCTGKDTCMAGKVRRTEAAVYNK